ALWANLDDWFLLGPAAVLVVGAARAAQASSSRAWRDLGLLVLGCFAACLLTPYHVRGLTLPSALGLSEAAPALPGDPLGESLVLSRLTRDYWQAAPGLTAGGLALPLLALLGLLSLALNAGRARRGHALLWGGLLLLAAYQARATPFFAIASAPLIA